MRHLSRALIVLLLLSLSVITFAQEQTHTVQSGENLYRISLRYNVSLTALAQANGITNPNLIFVGQVLKIPGTTGGTTPPPATTQPPATQPPATTGTYTVVAGDTLGRLAQRFGTTVAAIQSANNISNPNRIFVGQVLKIAGATGTTPPPTQAPGGNNPPPTNTAPITGFELGGHVFSFSYSDLMRNTKMTWIKKQIRWNQGESVDAARNLINEGKSRGFRVLLGIVGNKDQLAANPTQYYQDFANYLGQVAAAGADGIEVWNEPNIDREWPANIISGAQYTQMLSAAYQAIKRANSNTLVISGAPSPTGFFGGGCGNGGCDDDRFIRDMSAAGARNFMDCVGVHYNSGMISPSQTSNAPVGNPNHYSWYYQGMVNLYSRTFPGKPLCFTELGYLTPQGYGALPANFQWAQNVTVANQAEWLADAVRRSRSSGIVRLLIIWNVDNTVYTGEDPQAGYAIIRPDGTCPACNAIAPVMQ